MSSSTDRAGRIETRPLPASAPMKYRRLDEYIKSLPRGLDSYPACRMKASIYRRALESKPLLGLDRTSLPASLCDLIDEPLLVSSWMEATKGFAVIMLVADHYGMSDDETRRWLFDLNQTLFGGRLYRGMMKLASPTLLMRIASNLFGAFHQGMSFELTELAPNSAGIVLRYPQLVVSNFVASGLGEVFSCAFSVSNAKNVTVRVDEVARAHARFTVRWDKA